MVKDWSSIKETYLELEDRGLAFQSMVNLVEAIIQSSELSKLYAWTSMHDLCIVQTPVEYPYDGPFLKVSPLFNGSIEFRYLDTGIKENQWHHIVIENQAASELMNFVEKLHWFVKYEGK